MSSEMRAHTTAELLALYDANGGDWCKIARAVEERFLARTEAVADGAVAWIRPDGVTTSDDGLARHWASQGLQHRPLVYGDTHPQDASGDAVMREALERIRDYEGDPRTPVRNSVRKSGIARAALNAMQAKEAK